MAEIKDINENREIISESELIENLEAINKRRREFGKSKLEFFLTDINMNKRLGRSIPNLLTSFFKDKFPYDALHAGLKIDEILVDWGDKIIVFPGTNLQSILFAFEIKNEGFWNKITDFFSNLARVMKNLFTTGSFGSWDITDLTEKQLDAIATICVAFNRYKTYNFVSCNCQHFVNTILKKLGCENKFGPELKRIMEEIQENGAARITYKGREFRNRKDFDEFAIHADFDNLSNEDKELLLCYNSIFDIKEVNEKDNPLMKCQNKSFWEEKKNEFRFKK